MLVRELIQELAKYDEDASVYYTNYDDMGLVGYEVVEVRRPDDPRYAKEYLGVEKNSAMLDMN
ncbi:MAG: hypothetical protein JRE28_10360 [Deltaproteobacteria bacterium]|nr:hypothetical protein [Deltaproteobacteria bacterium]